jgi:signal peptide peptidase SppA
MRYGHIVQYVASQVWAIQPEKMQELLSVLVFRACGQAFTPAEIQARIGPAKRQAQSASSGSVAVVPLRGVIAHRMGTLDESSGGMSAERFTQQIRAAAADDSIGAIVMDVDSPGGTVAGLVEAADAVFEARQRKPVVAVANATMASAAYWLASQATSISAIPSALDNGIGSIGVFSVHADISAALKKEGIKVTLIKSGEHKAEGNQFEPLSKDTREHIQASVDAAKTAFVGAVARGRGISREAVVGLGDGRAFAATDALKVGLVDAIEPFDEVLSRLVGGQPTRTAARADVGDRYRF